MSPPRCEPLNLRWVSANRFPPRLGLPGVGGSYPKPGQHKALVLVERCPLRQRVDCALQGSEDPRGPLSLRFAFVAEYPQTRGPGRWPAAEKHTSHTKTHKSISSLTSHSPQCSPRELLSIASHSEFQRFSIDTMVLIHFFNTNSNTIAQPRPCPSCFRPVFSSLAASRPTAHRAP